MVVDSFAFIDPFEVGSERRLGKAEGRADLLLPDPLEHLFDDAFLLRGETHRLGDPLPSIGGKRKPIFDGPSVIRSHAAPQ